MGPSSSLFSLFRRRAELKLAICFHVFFEDIAEDMINMLRPIRDRYTLFVSHPREGISPSLARKFAALDCEIHYIPTENAGRDVGPFLAALTHPEMRHHDLVCKIHTKRGDSALGATWRHQMLKAVIGHKANFRAIYRAFRDDPKLMMAGAEVTHISAQRFMYKNAANVRALAELLNVPTEEDWGFFAGTMFWARRSIFDPVIDVVKGGLCFEEERGAKDGELAHALERIFGLLPRIAGGSIRVIRPKTGAKVCQIASAPPSTVAISTALSRISA